LIFSKSLSKACTRGIDMTLSLNLFVRLPPELSGPEVLSALQLTSGLKCHIKMTDAKLLNNMDISINISGSDSPEAAHARATAAFRRGTTRPLAWRRSQLEALQKMFEAERETFLAAMYQVQLLQQSIPNDPCALCGSCPFMRKHLPPSLSQDYNKPRHETNLAEIMFCLMEIAHSLKHLEEV
jgi:hypothetical protein